MSLETGSSIPSSPRPPLSPFKSTQNTFVPEATPFKNKFYSTNTRTSHDEKFSPSFQGFAEDDGNGSKRRKKNSWNSYDASMGDSSVGQTPASYRSSLGWKQPLTPSSPRRTSNKRKRNGTRVSETEPVSLESKLNSVLEFSRGLGLSFSDLIYEVFRTPTLAEKGTWGPKECQFELL